MNQQPRVSAFAGVLLISTAMLMLETLLPRVYAVYVGPNFVYFSISIALVGLSSGGIIVSVWDRAFSTRPKAKLAFFGLLFSVATFLAAWTTYVAGTLLNEVIDGRYAEILATTAPGSPASIFARSIVVPSMLFVLVTGLVTAVPFLLAGLCISLAFRIYAGSIGKIYAFDLFGAGLGCVLVVVSLTWLSATNSFILTCLIAAAGAWLLAFGAEGHGPAIRRMCVGTTAVFGVILLLGVTARPLFEFQIHRYAHLRSFLDGPAEETEHKWSPLGRISLLHRQWSPPWNETPRVRPKHFVAMDLGGHSVIEKFTPENLEVIKNTSVFTDDIMEPTVVPGFYRDLRRYLILMAGNGQDMLRVYAWYGDRVELEGVELNPVVYEFGFDYPPANLQAFFSKPNVKMHVDEGRSFVERADKTFDLILLSYSGATFATGTGSLASTPQFLFTKEAFVTYLKKLTHGGVLVVAGGTGPEDLPDSMRTFAAALKELDPQADARHHVICYRRRGAPLTEYYTLYHREPLPPEEVEKIRDALSVHGLDLTYSSYAPSAHARMEEFRQSNRATLTSSRFGFPPMAQDRVHTDDRPFFYFDLVWGSIGGYLVVGYIATFFSALAVAVLFLLVPLLVNRRAGQTRGVHWFYLLAFSMLGAGFMLIEVGSIQKFELFLGSPQLTLAVILADLLVFTGLGSYYSSRLFDRGTFSIRKAAFSIVTYGAFVLLFLNFLIYRLMGFGLAVKILIIAVVLLPLGFLLGTLFPQLVRLIEPTHARFIPVAWAINAVFSVAASNLGSILYLFLGANSVVALGLLCYAVLGLAASATAPRAAPAG